MILIRPMKKADIPQIISRFSFPWSSPEKTQALWDNYYREQREGIRTVGVVEENRNILGYGSFLRRSENPRFERQGIPDINAIWIHEHHRRQGLGSALIEWIEELARQEGYPHIGIGVGLYADYGPAQKLYIKLGFVPNGNGITYKGQTTTPGETYPLDDELLLWLVKPLSRIEP